MRTNEMSGSKLIDGSAGFSGEGSHISWGRIPGAGANNGNVCSPVQRLQRVSSRFCQDP